MENNSKREHKALEDIRAVVDAYNKGSITVTTEGDFDSAGHRYDISVILAIVTNHAYEGLGLAVPGQSERKGGESHEIPKSVS
ncbi:hypothetical protein I6E50_08215 [Roseburia hominis]|uniref:hypothetical protein n=1 Tax=Roseburia hominis TaxID=301301 RepID=UPI001F2E1FC3|nr:hypothetical protein [Roseburia hominis]